MFLKMLIRSTVCTVCMVSLWNFSWAGSRYEHYDESYNIHMAPVSATPPLPPALSIYHERPSAPGPDSPQNMAYEAYHSSTPVTLFGPASFSPTDENIQNSESQNSESKGK